MSLLIFLIIFIILFDISGGKGFNNLILENKTIDPYIFVIKGNAIIKRDKIIKLKINDKSDIKTGDRIRTFSGSYATIFWPDESITRLGEKTSITINKLSAKSDLSATKIIFDIEGGKTWSNVIRYLNEQDSYFIETYKNKNIAATVRGTVFEFNVDKNYINALDHTVQIEDQSNKKTYNISGGKAVLISDLSKLIQQQLYDNVWINLNKNEDIVYISKLIDNYKKQLNFIQKNENKFQNVIKIIQTKIGLKPKENINDLLKDIIVNGKIEKIGKVEEVIKKTYPEDSIKLNKLLLNLYQKVNYFPNTENNIILKTKLRDSIIKTAPESKKNAYIKDFIKINLFDYLEATNNGLTIGRQELKNHINNYIKIIGDKDIINDILQNFNTTDLGQIKEDFYDLRQKINFILENLKENDYTKGLQDQIINNVNNIKENILNIINK